ncbi:MAG: acyl-CoA thioesterase [Methylacidiphilales bacterium]|nr:acyl-CoA thioesterase [Candidatus Methylacidiphilales bacterium]NJR15421.1 acyl-CoA thioesterase [Calothrix sp. CSU_2_0]
MAFIYYRTVRFQDTDAAGVVYFANIFKICHEAYEESLDTSGINIKDFFLNPKIAYPIVHANVDFFKPLFCGDKLEVRLIAQKIANEKFEIIYEIFRDDLIVSKALTRHVCIEVVSRKKREIPDILNQWIQTLISK